MLASTELKDVAVDLTKGEPRCQGREEARGLVVQSRPLLELSKQFSFDPFGNLAKEELYVHGRKVLSASFVASATSVLKLWWTAVRRKQLLLEASSQVQPGTTQ